MRIAQTVVRRLAAMCVPSESAESHAQNDQGGEDRPSMTHDPGPSPRIPTPRSGGAIDLGGQERPTYQHDVRRRGTRWNDLYAQPPKPGSPMISRDERKQKAADQNPALNRRWLGFSSAARNRLESGAYAFAWCD